MCNNLYKHKQMSLPKCSLRNIMSRDVLEFLDKIVIAGYLECVSYGDTLIVHKKCGLCCF